MIRRYDRIIARSRRAGRLAKSTIGIAVLAALLALPASSFALDGADNWRNLSPKEREDVLRNYQRWQSLPPRDKQYLREEWDHWRSLPADERDRLRKRYDELSPKEQRRLREQFNGKKPRNDRRND